MDILEKINSSNSCIYNKMQEFEVELKKIINTDNNFLSEDLNTFLFNNPKRLRPRFIFLFAKILNIYSPLVMKIAIIAELIHNASLLHDDIIDNEEYRRKNLTFYKKYGTKSAVLEGDYLLSLALNELSETNLKILNIFSLRIKNTILGEIKQNENLNKIPDFDTYIDKTFNKTGNLFLAGIEAVFALKKIDKTTKKQILDFMKNYSIAFQINNDIYNFKNSLSDIKNGNNTLPVIYFEQESKDINDISKYIDKYSKKSYETVDKYLKKAFDSLEKIQSNNIKHIKELSILSLRS